MLEALHTYRLTRLNRRPDMSGSILATRGLSRRIGEKKRHHCMLCCSALECKIVNLLTFSVFRT